MDIPNIQKKPKSLSFPLVSHLITHMQCAQNPAGIYDRFLDMLPMVIFMKQQCDFSAQSFRLGGLLIRPYYCPRRKTMAQKYRYGSIIQQRYD